MHGMAPLSHAEFQAAQNALAKVAGTTGSLGSGLRTLAQSATQIGGSTRPNTLRAPGLLPGSGSDTFAGGARNSLLASLGRDTIVGGSTKPFAGSLEALGGHNIGNFTLSADTINLAGTTALSIKTLDPAENVKGHTVAVGDKTTITINGLSVHDISKLSH